MTRESEQDDGPFNDDALYRLTRRGEAVLDEWLHSPQESYPMRMREPFMLRLFFAGRLDPSLVGQLLAGHIDAVSELLAGLQKIAADIGQQFTRDELPFEDRLKVATLDRGIAYAETKLRWATGLHDELSGEPARIPAASA